MDGDEASRPQQRQRCTANAATGANDQTEEEEQHGADKDDNEVEDHETDNAADDDNQAEGSDQSRIAATSAVAASSSTLVAMLCWSVSAEAESSRLPSSLPTCAAMTSPGS